MSNDYSSLSNLGGTMPSLWAFPTCTENGLTKEFHEPSLSICLGLVLCWAPVRGTAEPVPLRGGGGGSAWGQGSHNPVHVNSFCQT